MNPVKFCTFAIQFSGMRIGLLVFFVACTWQLFAQSKVENKLFHTFSDIQLRIDTNTFTLRKNTILYRQEPHLAFAFDTDNPMVEIRFFPTNPAAYQSEKWHLIPSEEFLLIDSLRWINDSYFRVKLQFKSLTKSDFTSLVLEQNRPQETAYHEVKLFPHTETRAIIYNDQDELYIGEEKRFELITNHVDNLQLSGEWQKQGDFEYRLIERNGSAFLILVPLSLGSKTFSLKLDTKKPFLAGEKISYQLPRIQLNFTVKGSRLSFLKMDKREIVKEGNYEEGIEIQIDNHRNLQINKTYRLEDREERGGPLIAELYTVRKMSNDRVLCLIRPYQLHNNRNGYLFIKDNDNPLFITNVDILPELKISKVSILRDGKSWSTDVQVFPGETVDVKIEGEGMNRGRFLFEDAQWMLYDSATSNDRVANYKLKIPVDIKKRTMELYQAGRKMGNYLQVVEFQKPKILDFVLVNYGDGPRRANTLTQPVLYGNTIKDIVFSFDPTAIDDADHLNGKQFLEVDIRITGPKGELIEIQRIDYIEVCPGENSPRFAFYDNGNCNKQDISLNAILSRKTYSLDHWSKIELTIRHKRDKYSSQGFSQKIDIYLQRLSTFDVEVSFPAGLVIKKVGVDGFPGLGGISLAMIAQFSFYEKDKIRRLHPYKIGAGFLAQNAFNFNPDVQDRDLGIVVLGSVYPTRKDTKLSFPLYGGFGYFLNQDKFFFLIGPGIRINF